MSIKVNYVFRVMMLLSECHRLSQLPVSLAIQLVSPDEYRPALLCGIYQDEVSRDALILMNLDYLADLHLRRCDMRIVALASHSLIPLIVQFLVALPPLYVIPGLLHQCNCEDKGQGCNVGEQKSDLQRGDQLGETDEEEEEVEEELELVEEHHRDEGQQVILRVVELVTQVALGAVVFSVQVDRPFLQLYVSVLHLPPCLVPSQNIFSTYNIGGSKANDKSMTKLMTVSHVTYGKY